MTFRLLRLQAGCGTLWIASSMLGLGTSTASAQVVGTSTHLFANGTIMSSADVSAQSATGSSSSVLNRAGTYNTTPVGANASTTSFSSSADAGFGDLHLNLSANAMSNFAGGEVEAGITAHGEIAFNDRIRFTNPLLPDGTDVLVTLSLAVQEQLTASASAPSFGGNGAQSDILVTLSINGPGGSLGNIQFSDSTVASPVYQYFRAPSDSGFGSSATFTLKLGVQYDIAGVMTGSASASAHAIEGHSPTETAAAGLDAGHTALFSVVPQTPGTALVSNSGGSYQAVPEPRAWTLMAGVGLVAWAGCRRWRQPKASR